MYALALALAIVSGVLAVSPPIGAGMTSAAGAILVGTLGIRPLPDARAALDSLTYTFSAFDGTGAGGSLRIATDGKVTYHHSSAPFTGSGGIVTNKSWELTRDERGDLVAKMVADGLLDTPGREPTALSGGIRVTSGRWSASVDADRVPEKALRHLRPLLEKAHPELWSEKPPAPAPRKPESNEPQSELSGVLWQFNYHFATNADGDHTLLYVGRKGEVSYQRYGHPIPGVTKTHVRTSWTIPAEDAEALLDALAVNGVCDLEVAPRDKFPVHRVEVGCGRWWSTFYTKPLPEKLLKRVLPLLQKADPEFWKQE